MYFPDERNGYLVVVIVVHIMEMIENGIIHGWRRNYDTQS